MYMYVCICCVGIVHSNCVQILEKIPIMVVDNSDSSTGIMQHQTRFRFIEIHLVDIGVRSEDQVWRPAG